MLWCKFLFLTATALALSACGKDGDSGGKSRGGSGDAIALSGKWATDCMDESGSSYFTRNVRDFSGRTFTQSLGTFVDSLCTKRALTQEQSGPFTLGDASEDVEDAFEVDLTTTMFLVTLHSSDLVTAYNNRGVCGGGWVRNEARTYDRETCGDGQADDDNTVYDLVLRDDDELFFGAKSSGNTGASAAQRPASIDRAKAFSKI